MRGVRGGIPTGVHVLLERAGRVLLLRRAGTGFFDGLYSLPGGHVEPGESVRDAAVREMVEETGISLSAQALAYVGVVHRLSDSNRIDFFLHATVWTGEPNICEPHKCDALAWFDRAGLPEDTVDYIRVALASRATPWMIELGWGESG